MLLLWVERGGGVWAWVWVVGLAEEDLGAGAAAAAVAAVVVVVTSVVALVLALGGRPDWPAGVKPTLSSAMVRIAQSSIPAVARMLSVRVFSSPPWFWVPASLIGKAMRSMVFPAGATQSVRQSARPVREKVLKWWYRVGNSKQLMD
jgi:hypothetical protein